MYIGWTTSLRFACYEQCTSGKSAHWFGAGAALGELSEVETRLRLDLAWILVPAMWQRTFQLKKVVGVLVHSHASCSYSLVCLPYQRRHIHNVATQGLDRSFPNYIPVDGPNDGAISGRSVLKYYGTDREPLYLSACW